MTPEKITDLYKFLDSTGPESKHEIVLYRGQRENLPLIPRIARSLPARDTSDIERKMLAELRRTGGSQFPHNSDTDLDLLVRAQHAGMATRLLDWSSNPLIALWFALSSQRKDESSYVYFFDPIDENPPTSSEIKDPFSVRRTSIFKPNLNNPRITAQSGWFTLHGYSRSGKGFIPLERNVLLKKQIDCYQIDWEFRHDFLDDLNHMGVNAQTVFPDSSGLCEHLNWKFDV